MVLAGGMGIGANTSHRGKALSCTLVVTSQISCEHPPDEIRETPVFLSRQCVQSFIASFRPQRVSYVSFLLNTWEVFRSRESAVPR